MTLETWLANALGDAERRGLPGLRPLLEALVRSTMALRAADWNEDPGAHEPSDAPRKR